MDKIDRKIIAELQRDATISVANIAARVGLSQTPCWTRIQKLEQSGILTGRVALVDPVKVGLGLTVFVEIEAADHSPEWRDSFAAAIVTLPEVTEVYRMAGAVDYMLKVVTSDMIAFDRFYKQLTGLMAFKNVTSHFTMERIHFTTALVLPDPII